MEVYPTGIPGLLRVVSPRHVDERGCLIKPVIASRLALAGAETKFEEVFYSVSSRHVLRGMHMQASPHGHGKVVHVLQGTVLDAVLDLRASSPRYRSYETFHLDSDHPQTLYVPVGCAHGFLVLSDSATMLYLATGPHVRAAECGVRWNSFGFSWPVSQPIVSQRDAELPTLVGFSHID